MKATKKLKTLLTLINLMMTTNIYSSSFISDDQLSLKNYSTNNKVNLQTQRSTLSLEGKLKLNEQKKPTIELDAKKVKSFNVQKFQDLLNSPALKKKGGFSSGGGGNSVVCFSDGGDITEVELLDYYEGIRKDNSLVKGLGIAGKTVDEKIVNAFNTLSDEYPRLSLKLKNRALWLHKNMNSHLIEARDGQLSPVYDMNIPFVPQYNEQGDECMIVRFAVQLKEHVEGQKKFFFVKDLYEHPLTSDDTRAGIIIHETIYEEAINNGAINSDFVRWLTYIISSKKISQMSNNEIAALQYQPGGEFLGNLGVDVNPRRVVSYDFTDLKARDRVYALDIYDIETSHGSISCYELGMCELLDGEFIGRKRGSSDFLPKFNIMLRKNTIIAPTVSTPKAIETKRGENIVLSDENIANRKDNICTKRGACVGDLVGVTKDTNKVSLSYTGVVVGIFGDGNLAIEVIGGRFDVYNEDMDPINFYNSDKKVILYASKKDVSF